MTLRQLLAAWPFMVRQQKIINQQQALIAERENQIHHLILDHCRDMQGLVSAWLISLETPEIDMRHDLAELDREFGHRIAQLEEHIL